MTLLQSVLTRLDSARRREFLRNWAMYRGVRHVDPHRRRYEATLCLLVESRECLRSSRRVLERARNRVAIMEGLILKPSQMRPMPLAGPHSTEFSPSSSQ